MSIVLRQLNMEAMNTRLSVVIPTYKLNVEKYDEILHAIQIEVTDFELAMSRFNPSGFIGKLNSSNAETVMEIPEWLYVSLKLAEQLRIQTFGYFDIGVNSSKKKKNISTANLLFDDQEPLVRLASPEIQIDLGGIGKGLALDSLSAIFLENEIESAFVSFGESSVMAIGAHPHGKSWKTAVPALPPSAEYLFTFDIPPGYHVSISSSWKSGKENDFHIIDPTTGEVVKKKTIAGVMAKSGAVAEALSTALVCAPNEIQKKIINRFKEISVFIADETGIFTQKLDV